MKSRVQARSRGDRRRKNGLLTQNSSKMDRRWRITSTHVTRASIYGKQTSVSTGGPEGPRTSAARTTN